MGATADMCNSYKALSESGMLAKTANNNES